MQLPSLKQLEQLLKYRLFTTAQQQAFLEDIAMLVEDGVIVNQAVETIAKSSAGLPVEVANSILVRLAEGKQFADGMRNWFADSVVEIVRAGEEGGTLAASMQAAAKTLTQRSAAIVSLLNSLTYPLIILVLGLVVTVFVKNSVFDSFAAIKPVSQWPSNGQTVMALADFVQYWWWVVLLITIGLLVGISYLLRNYIGGLRPGLDQVPVLSMYRKLTAARFMGTLGLLISNGVILKKALKILQRNANPYLASHLLAMEYRLSGGKENMAEVLDTGLLDENDLMRLRVIAKGKGFEHALIRQGRKAAEQGMQSVQVTGRILGAILLVSGGGLAAFIVVSIYSIGATLSGAG